ncbi:hypothetical protein [Nannocystis sp. SCPEA4]|nr:hypothetical protein [Nannocystis sp. SCPEA4]MCY1056244.1 hypothetical protein [Nannocystis sp. SCPEA4]
MSPSAPFVSSIGAASSRVAAGRRPPALAPRLLFAPAAFFTFTGFP